MTDSLRRDMAPTLQNREFWWDDCGFLHRYLCDLIGGELTRLRPGGARLPARPWGGRTRVEEELGMDSLERLSVAAVLAEAIHLHASGIEESLLTRQTIGEWVQLAAEGLARFDSRITFQTSGSVGVPKACCHALCCLDEEATVLAELFHGCRRIVSAVPTHHIYGFLFTVLLPWKLGISADAVIDARCATPALLAGTLRAGDLVVGHPIFWEAFVRGTPSVPSSVQGVTSTAPCPPDVARNVVESGVERLTQVYGSSETAGVGWRNAADAPYTLLPYWQRCGADAGRLERVADNVVLSVRCPDGLEWLDERRFTVGKRLDDAVQIGGVNVFPARVRDVLLAHPSVADAVVRMMRAEEGNRLKAFVVPQAEEERSREAMIADLSSWVAARLSVAERPKSFTFGPSLPVAASGKSADWVIGMPEGHAT